VSWRGTCLLGIIALLALGFFIYSDVTDTAPHEGPLLGLDPSLADNIRIQESGSGFSLIKTNGLWSIQGPVNDRADPRVVHALLQTAADIMPLDQLGSHEIKGNVSLSSLNLKKPTRVITIRAKKTHTLWLGVEGPATGEIYSRLDGGKTVYLIDGKIADISFHPLQEYRDPRLTALSSERIEEASLKRGEGMQQLHLTRNSHGWTLDSPISTRGDSKAISDWLNAWVSARVTSWIPEGTDPSSCGMDSPTATVTLREEGESTPLTITVGAPVPDSPGSFYVRCSDRPGICSVAELTPDLTVTPLSLRSKKLQQVEYDTIDRIEIATGSIIFSLTRKPESDGWQINQGGKIVDLPGGNVKGWFDQLQGLSAITFEPATPEHLAQRGLDQLSPSSQASQPVRIRFMALLSENTAQENAGEVVLDSFTFGAVTGNEVALHEGDAADLMILPASALDLAKKPPLPSSPLPAPPQQ
jgi:hypothetical protein